MSKETKEIIYDLEAYGGSSSSSSSSSGSKSSGSSSGGKTSYSVGKETGVRYTDNHSEAFGEAGLKTPISVTIKPQDNGTYKVEGKIDAGIVYVKGGVTVDPNAVNSKEFNKTLSEKAAMASGLREEFKKLDKGLDNIVTPNRIGGQQAN